VVNYNGELYNFRELRAELEATGSRFGGTSDTEVLVAAIERWGLSHSLERANGMFALAVWDAKERSLHLARDRFGEKPLYYGWAGRVFLFGSELKALRAHPRFEATVDRDALALYFRHNCVPAPYSIYAGVSKLPPGTMLRVDGDPGAPASPEPYWSLGDVVAGSLAARRTGSIEDSVDELEAVLGSAVGSRMYADVPMGAFLSGGIDSSLVVALMQARAETKVRTFTIAFDEAAFDEAAHAAAVSSHLGTDHTELLVTGAQALEVVPSLPVMFDEPFADSSQVPQAVLARLTRSQVTVALSGDGGDELFAGYNRYAFAARWWPKLSKVPAPLRGALASAITRVPVEAWDGAFGRLAPLLPASLRIRMPGTKLHKAARVLPASGPAEVHRLLASHVDDPAQLVLGATEPQTALSSPEAWPAGTSAVEAMQYLDTVTYLPDDILTKVDRATMAVALETRLPFLDPAVASLAWRMPPEHKLEGGTGKRVLRQLLHRYVPAALVERPKAGFGIPLAAWLRGPLRPWAADLLAPSVLARQGYLAPERVARMWAEHDSSQRDWGYELWDVLMLQAWLAEWLPQ
ncbi:MAG: asparagine synthase (glutamine-hydrolyzing), partial [Acidobacteriota bacterium]|nr:asparagine synthase (glutamine-hydrolyzing) [Acidobacteriota bacterium]